MGLDRARGSNAVTLAEVRVGAGELYRAVRAGIDPLAANDAAAGAARAATQQDLLAARTFRQAAEDFIANRTGKMPQRNARRSMVFYSCHLRLPAFRWCARRED